VRVEARAEGRGGLEAAMRPHPPRFTPRRRGSPDELPKPVEHALIPAGRITSEIAAFPDQPIRAAHVLEPQEVRLRHPSMLGLMSLDSRSPDADVVTERVEKAGRAYPRFASAPRRSDARTRSTAPEPR